MGDVGDILNDPAFPDRPQHPDFWRLSDVALQMDGSRKTPQEYAAGLIDYESLVYMATNRAGTYAKAMGITDPDLQAVIATAMLAGILHGLQFERRGGTRP